MPTAMHAIIDVGSNSVLMLMGRRSSDGSVDVEDDRVTTTRLSQGVAQTGQLNEAAIERTLAALRDNVQLARAAGAQVRAFATAGVRMAGNAEAFLNPAAEVVGAPVRVLSGEEEARLSYQSVSLELPGQRCRVLDIGGASTELVDGRGLEVDDARSHAMGSVRFTEAFVDSDPPSEQAVERMRGAARARFADQPLPPHPVLHGLAGTITSLGAVVLELETYDRDVVDGTRVSRGAVQGALERMASMTSAQRCEATVLAPNRADVFVAGLCIAIEALDHCGATELVVRDRGHRYALLGRTDGVF